MVFLDLVTGAWEHAWCYPRRIHQIPESPSRTNTLQWYFSYDLPGHFPSMPLWTNRMKHIHQDKCSEIIIDLIAKMVLETAMARTICTDEYVGSYALSLRTGPFGLVHVISFPGFDL